MFIKKAIPFSPTIPLFSLLHTDLKDSMAGHEHEVAKESILFVLFQATVADTII